MLHVCDQKINVTGNLEKICELNKAQTPWKERSDIFGRVFFIQAITNL